MSDLASNDSSNSKTLKSKKVKETRSITLDDIIDLSVVELYILNFLVRIAGSSDINSIVI